MPSDDLVIRAAHDADSDGIIRLISKVYAEYPGCVMDVDGEEPELRSPASSFDDFWVVEDAGEIVGCVGLSLRRDEMGVRVELKKVYVDRALRGRRLGRRLIETVEGRARELGAHTIELWSDTRFVTAHAVYEHMSYVRSGRERELHDLSATREYHFTRRLGNPSQGDPG